jgi:hypothetical protein
MATTTLEQPSVNHSVSGRVLRLIPNSPRPPSISDDTVHEARRLLAIALTGKLQGFAFVGALAGGKYILDAVGEAWETPDLTRGRLCMLSDNLGMLARGQMPDCWS